MLEKVCKLPELDELKHLLKEKNNLVWYFRWPEIEGPKESIDYLNKQIEKFKKEKKEKYGGL